MRERNKLKGNGMKDRKKRIKKEREWWIKIKWKEKRGMRDRNKWWGKGCDWTEINWRESEWGIEIKGDKREWLDRKKGKEKVIRDRKKSERGIGRKGKKKEIVIEKGDEEQRR